MTSKPAHYTQLLKLFNVTFLVFTDQIIDNLAGLLNIHILVSEIWGKVF